MATISGVHFLFFIFFFMWDIILPASTKIDDGLKEMVDKRVVDDSWKEIKTKEDSEWRLFCLTNEGGSEVKEG